MSDFDDLFNEFFNPEEPKKNSDNNEDNDAINDEAQKMIDMINNFRNNPEGMDLDKIDEELEDSLGDPDLIENEFDGEFYFEKRTWYKPSGIIIKTIISESAFNEEEIIPELSLNEQLEKAVAAENYELAAEIRDKIKKDIAKQNRQAKKLLKENPEYQVITKKDEKK